MNEKIEEYELVCYNTDSSGMSGKTKNVFFPKTVKEIKDVIATSKDVIPRGLGSNIVGSCIPSDSVVLDMKCMNKVVFDAETKTAIVEGGVTLRELNEKLNSVGFEFPIYGEGTIGGMIAMNSPSTMGKYGRIKDWIEEVEMINGRGELARINKTDLGDVCGKEGITGVIIKARLRLVAFSEKSISIFQTEKISNVWSVVGRLRDEKDVVMLRLYSPSVSRLLGFPEKYHLIIVFNSSRGKINGKEYDELFNKIRRDYCFLYAQGYGESSDPELSFDKLGEFILFLNKFNIPYISDLNLGIIFPFFNDDIKKGETLKMIKRMNARPGKYGFGLRRKGLVEVLERKIIQRIKLRHDPSGKMNRGKVIDFEGIGEREESLRERKDEENSGSILKEIEDKRSLKTERDFDKGEVDRDLISKVMLNKGEDLDKIRGDNEDEDRRA